MAKRLTSLLCALTFIVSTFVAVPVMAEEEAVADASAEAITEETTEDVFDGTYLSIDFEEFQPIVTTVTGGNGDHSYKKDASGNTYMEVVTNWGNTGYMFPEPLKFGALDYHISFDFKSTGNNRPTMYSLTIADSSITDADNIYNMFGLVGLPGGGKMRVADNIVEGLEFIEGRWYHYDMVFNLGGTLDITVTDIENPENVGTFKGASAVGSSASNGIPTNRTYDMLRFGVTGTWSIDNILIEESKEFPLQYSAKTSQYGNIFKKEDSKDFEVEFHNLLTNDLKANIEYVITDDDGNLIDKGDLGAFTFAKRAKKTVKVTPKVEEYGVFDLQFNMKTEDVETGTTNEYLSGNTMFSVANKRAADEPVHNLAASVSSGFTSENWPELTTIAMDAGISTVRIDFRWYAIERRVRGIFNEYDPPDVDYAYFDEVRESGLDIMSILSEANVLYSKGQNDFVNMSLDSPGVDPGMYDRWIEYLEWTTTEMADHHSIYEVFNETDYRIPPAKYCEYLKTVKQIVEKNDPTKPVIAFATSGVPYAWLEQCFDIIGENWQDYFDGISVHPYDFDRGEWAAKPGLDADGWSVIIREGKYLEKTRWLVSMMNEYGYQAPIYHTEVAMSSTPGLASMKSQAADLAQLYVTSLAEPSIEQVYWYSYQNTSERGSEPVTYGWRNANYGIIGHKNDTVPHAAKPAYVAMAGFNKFFTNAELIDSFVETEEISDATRAYRFKRPDGQQVAAIWTEWGADDVLIDLGVNEIEIFDMYTNSLGKMKSENGKYSLTTTFEPIYIKGDFTKMEVDVYGSMITSDKPKANAVKNDRVEITLKDKLGRNLTIKAKGTPYAEVTQKTDIVNGVGKIVVETNDDSFEEEPVEIFAYDGDNLVWYSMHHIIIGDEAITIAYDTVKDLAGADRDVMAVSVSNKTAGTELDGVVTGDFTKIGGEIEKRNLMGLKPGQTKTVYLNLPIFRNIKVIRTNIDANFGEIFHIGGDVVFTPSFTASYNNTGVKGLDVFKENFVSNDWFTTDDINAYYHTGSDWEGIFDCSANGTLLWDEDYLYVFVEVLDDVFKQDYLEGQIWNGDSIQIGVQSLKVFEGLDGEFTGRDNYNEFGVAKTTEGVQAYRWSAHPSTDQVLGFVPAEEYECEIEVEGNRTYYRLALPWQTAVGEDTLSEGNQLMFSMVVNDNDGKNGLDREGFMQLTEGLGSGKTALKFANITLKK